MIFQKFDDSTKALKYDSMYWSILHKRRISNHIVCTNVMQNGTKISWCSNAHFSAGMPNKHPVKGMDYLSWTQNAALQTSLESVTIGAVHISVLKEQ